MPTAVVVAGFVVVTGRVVVVAGRVVPVVSGGGEVVATVDAVGVALGPVASGSVVTGSATSFAEAIPPNPSSASEISSRARRSTGSR